MSSAQRAVSPTGYLPLPDLPEHGAPAAPRPVVTTSLGFLLSTRTTPTVGEPCAVPESSLGRNSPRREDPRMSEGNTLVRARVGGATAAAGAGRAVRSTDPTDPTDATDVTDATDATATAT